MKNLIVTPLNTDSGARYSAIHESGNLDNSLAILDCYRVESLIYNLFDSLNEEFKEKVLKQLTTNK